MESIIETLKRKGKLTVADLAEEIGISRRGTFRAIQRLRRKGVPLCADGTGVWIATDRRSVAETAERQHHRAMQELQTYAALKNHLPPIDGQITLFEEENTE